MTFWVPCCLILSKMKAWPALSLRPPSSPPTPDPRPRPAPCALRPGLSLYLSLHLRPAFPLSTRPARTLPHPAPSTLSLTAPSSPGARPAPSPRARPLPALSRPPAPCPLRARSALARAPRRRLRRELLCPQLAQRGGGRGWAGAAAAAARAPSMSRRRRRPRAARGPTAARGLRGSYAGPDRGRQRPPILSPSVPPSLLRAVPSGRRRGQGGACAGPGSRPARPSWGRRRAPGAGRGTRVEGKWEPSAELRRTPPRAGQRQEPLVSCPCRAPGGLSQGVAGAHSVGGRGHRLAGPLPRAWLGGGGREI